MHVGLPVGKDQEGPSLQEVAHMFRSRAGVQRDSALRRSRASCSAAERASEMLFTIREASRARGSKTFPEGGGRGMSPFSVRRLFIQSAILAMGGPCSSESPEGWSENEEGAHQQPDEIILPDEGYPILDLFCLIDHHHGPAALSS